jgi:hypothetical protein
MTKVVIDGIPYPQEDTWDSDDPVVLFDPVDGPITDAQLTDIVHRVMAMTDEERRALIEGYEGSALPTPPLQTESG